MGTFYKLIDDENQNKEGEFGIDEMSNKLSLDYINNEECYKSIKMTPEELARIFLYGLTICSYWMDTDKLKSMIVNHVDKNIW